MKKILLIGLTVVVINAQTVDLAGFSFNPFTGEYKFNQDKLIDMVGSCVPALPEIPNFDVCKLTEQVSLRGQFCGNNIDGNNALKKLCAQGQAKLKDKIVNSTIGSLPTFDTIFGTVPTLPSGRKIGDLDLDIAADKILKKAESIAYKSYTSGDQKVLKLLIDKLAKDSNTKGSGKNVKDITSIKLEDLKVPQNMEEYYDEIKQLQEAATADIKIASANKVAEQIGSDSTKAQSTVKELHQLIDKGTNTRIGIAKEALSRSDDYAMPTEEGIKYLRPDYKIQAIGKIYNQQMREAFLVAQIQKEAEAQKNIVSITAKKQIIINTKFPREETENRINALIEK